MLAILTVPMAKLGRGFFAFHTALALALEICAVAVDSEKRTAHLLFAAALAVLSILFWIRKLRWSQTLLYAAALLGVVALALDAGRLEGTSARIAGCAAILSSALVLGAALVTMNLGHWYLVIRGLPFDLLGIANRRFAGTLVVKILVILAGAAISVEAWRSMFSGAHGPLWDTLLFLTVRVAFGLMGPLVLAWMVHECVKIKSNQSATGILYVAVVFVMIGELSGMYFLLERGVPL